MADVKNFIKKWNHRHLEDWGSVVSPEFKSFQTAFINAMKKIAESCGGELVKSNKGHYYMSGFIKKGDKYIYFSYSSLDRTHVLLTPDYSSFPPMCVRTAQSDTDYHGGTNNNLAFSECEAVIQRLLEC